MGSQLSPGFKLWSGHQAGGWGSGQTEASHGATLSQLLCSRIRIINFVLNSKTADGGEDGVGRWACGGQEGHRHRENGQGPPSARSPLTRGSL